MTIYIPIKENSQRVPNKNFRVFDRKPLWERTVDKFAETEYNVFIDTDSEYIIEKCASKNVTAFYRNKSLIGDKVSVVSLLKDFKNSYEIEDIICQIHVTSPFLKISHIDAAFKKILLE